MITFIEKMTFTKILLETSAERGGHEWAKLEIDDEYEKLQNKYPDVEMIATQTITNLGIKMVVYAFGDIAIQG